MTSFYFKIISIFTLISMTGTISAAQRFGVTTTTINNMRSTLGDRAWIDEILEADIDPNITDEGGNTPLIVAVRHAFHDNYDSDDWFEIVIALLEAGANPSMPSFKRGWFRKTTITPLAEALNRDDTHRVTVALVQAKLRIIERIEDIRRTLFNNH